MDALSQYLSTLKKFNCIWTKNTKIPHTLTSLIYLDCSFTKIKKIPDILTSLTHLYCSNINITKIPDTLTSLTHLECYDTKITKIPDALTSLTYLDCDNCENLVYIPNYAYDKREIYYNNCPKLVRTYPERLIVELIDNCPICFDDSGTGYQCMNGHVIHVDCQKEWERLNPEQRICPYCRGRFKMVEKE